MTTTAGIARPIATARRRVGFDRFALAVLMPIGPLAIAVLRLVLPYYTTDSNTIVAARTAAHQGREMIVLWMILVASLTLIPGVIAVGMLARTRAPVLGTIGLVVSFAGFMNLFGAGVGDQDSVSLGAARIGMGATTAGRLIDSIDAIHPVGLGGAIFIFGHIVGVLLLGIALWRGRLVPVCAAVLLAVSQLLHLTFAVFVPNHLLDGLAWGLTALGFAAAAIALVRHAAENPA